MWQQMNVAYEEEILNFFFSEHAHDVDDLFRFSSG